MSLVPFLTYSMQFGCKLTLLLQELLREDNNNVQFSNHAVGGVIQVAQRRLADLQATHAS